MSSEEDSHPVEPSVAGASRRRSCRPELWKRSVEKRRNIARDGTSPSIACAHDIDHWCGANTLLRADILRHHDSLYTQATKALQDSHILQHITLQPVQRHRAEAICNERQHSTVYKVQRFDGVDVRICLETFSSIFCVSKRRVQRVAAYLRDKGCCRPELRGGKRVHDQVRRLRSSIRKHIETFKCVPSHYGRNKTPHRKYLKATLSIRKMWAMYNDACLEDPLYASCTYQQYRFVFATEYNLGFGSPRTDICTSCENKRQRMKLCLDPAAKLRLATELLIHKREARNFYRLLNGAIDESTAVFAIDMMQNQPLPKLPIGETFYSRQIWQYILGIVRHFGSESDQRIDNCYLYTWSEHEAGRGSDAISSALVDFFRQFVSVNPHITTIRIFSDSCAAQNKNYSLLAVLSALAQELKVVFELNYPVSGHSFLPADRMFGRLEKVLRRHDTILTPDEYYPLFAGVAVVRVLNQDWSIQCFKDATKLYVKAQQTFKISDMKFIRVRGGGVIETSEKYNHPPQTHDLMKVKKNFNLFRLRNVPIVSGCHPLKKEKWDDVRKLLSRAGIEDDHPCMSFYRRVEASMIQPESDDDASSSTSTASPSRTPDPPL